MRQKITIRKSELKKTRRQWFRKPQTQVLPSKKRPARHKEKELVTREWKESGEQAGKTDLS